MFLGVLLFSEGRQGEDGSGGEGRWRESVGEEGVGETVIRM